MMTGLSPSSPLARIEGTALPLRGNDIDTDRIIPARFLVSVTFEGLGAHAFADDRATAPAGSPHPFDDPAFAGATILLVNRNFGCGSSREHAPQALQRRGIRAIVGESFSEIFFGNATALGLPCVTLAPEAIAALQDDVVRTPRRPLLLDLRERRLVAGDTVHPAGLPEAIREAFLTGTWDATGLLLARFDEVRAVAARLPYVTGFSGV